MWPALADPISTAGQTPGGPGPVPLDAFVSPEVEALITRARESRAERGIGIEGYEARYTERFYVGAGGRALTRERAVFHRERVARVRWTPGEPSVIQWEGARSGVPIAGIAVKFEDDLSADDHFEFDLDMLDPATDRTTLGEGGALHPLADTAHYHYRYRAGDTLRIVFPAENRAVTLVEILVEAREASTDRITGSFWFDVETSVLARAVYRPAADFHSDRDPEAQREIPRLIQPVQAIVEHVVIDYELQERSWWLPSRVAMSARGSLRSEAVSFPFLYEMTFTDYVVNEPPTFGLDESLPPGWSTWTAFESSDEEADRDDGSDPPEGADPGAVADTARLRRMTVIVPPLQELVDSPSLPPPLYEGADGAFTRAELDDATRRLSGLVLPRPPQVSTFFGLPDVRYNRVEAFSPGIGVTMPTGANAGLRASGRIQTAGWRPSAQVTFYSGDAPVRWEVSGYSRVAAVDNWEGPLNLGNTLSSLLAGVDDGFYFRETGAEAGVQRSTGRLYLEASLWAARHGVLEKGTDFSMLSLVLGRDQRANLEARGADLGGIRASVDWLSGRDPTRPAVTLSLAGEAGTGSADLPPAGVQHGGAPNESVSYARILGGASVFIPAGRWAIATEVQAGRVTGDVLPQREFYLGGPQTLRGLVPGTISGPEFSRGRVELGLGFALAPRSGAPAAGLRIVGFFDVAAPEISFDPEGLRSSAGVGVSLLDGLLRMDWARGLSAGDPWRVHFYLDALM